MFKHSTKLLLSSFAMVSSATGLIACSTASKQEATTVSSDGSPASQDPSSATDTKGAAGIDYPKIYCENIGKIKLRTDSSIETGIFCRNGKPTDQMLQLRKEALSAEGVNNIKVEETIEAATDDAPSYSTFLVSWSFHSPLRPFAVKEKSVEDYIAKSFHEGDVTVTSSSTKRADDPLDSGLHLRSTDMNYAISIQATAGQKLEMSRNTQYNLYQVQSGNEEMGFGIEHLVDTSNPDFTKSTMVNLSFNDGNGYNDGKGGTVVINLLSFRINNRGFTSTAKETIMAITKQVAENMYQGLQ